YMRRYGMMNCSAFDWPTIFRDNSSTRSPCGGAVGSDRFSGVSMEAFFGGRYHTAAAGYRVCAIGTPPADGPRGARRAWSAIDRVGNRVATVRALLSDGPRCCPREPAGSWMQLEWRR